ncbi:tRNA (adenine-N(1)-)-methyltransferase [Ascosphaera apis ARSEF 7405]|uniref:tRNA (adenine(58)-N(1))-methyltransferase catalytic subunit TRM61 n=1 Tax=Ascosphaera apis ARSEF 7405 TaxID=392613 RepID=A0A167WM13_9EURO|nr:tRNA (adenine-N(1)-)-methyltransferase [Ascosphaera apis ARSEF 7405]
MVFSLLRRILAGPKATAAAAVTVPVKTSSAVKSSRRQGVDFNISTFKEGDRVLLHGKKTTITTPLKLTGKTKLHRGIIQHSDIIGKQARDAVKSSHDAVYRISYPTLEQYATLTPRLVTPVYPADASLIVSLLDIHVSPPSDPSSIPSEPLEILEAGTGHGSLTLQLSRAINAANSAPPYLPPRQTPVHKTKKTDLPEDDELTPEQEEEVRQWKERRNAIVHTVDISPAYSTHAETMIRGFRRGMYAGNIDFYTAPVEEWIENQLQQRQSKSKPLEEKTEPTPFLKYAILDMPSSHDRIPHVSRILKTDGTLAVFMPSVTQIGECVQLINELRLPLMLEKAVELGTGISSGRLWDVRTASVRRPRGLSVASSSSSSTTAVSEAEMESAVTEEEDSATQSEKEVEVAADGEEANISEEAAAAAAATSQPEPAQPDRRTVLVCRPKVGDKIVGGGFVGIWKKIKLGD